MLEFQEAGIRDLQITDRAEALLAPALLPRSWISHRALLALREAEVFIPLRGWAAQRVEQSLQQSGEVVRVRVSADLPG